MDMRALAAIGPLVILGALIAGCDAPTDYPRSSVRLPATTSTTSTTSPPETTSSTTTSTLLPPDGAAPEVDEATTVAVTDDLAALVVAASPGETFVLAPGVHRTSEVVPKDGMTFTGLPGAIMSGAIVLDGFESGDVAGWSASQP